MRKIIVLCLLAAGWCAEAGAQSLAALKERLARSENGATVVVEEHGDAAQTVRHLSERTERMRFKGYRIGIFFDNSAEARANAVAAKKAFEEDFADIPVYLVYENPYFKVSAGNCVTSEEAIVLLGKIRGRFPEAYLMREDLTVADLVR